MKKILIIDDSKKRTDLLKAARFWTDLIEASISFLSVIDESAVRDTTRAIGVIGKVAKAVKGDLVEGTKETIYSDIKETKVECEEVIVKIGLPLDEIKGFIDRLSPDLIIMARGIKSGVINITGEIIGYFSGNSFVITNKFTSHPIKSLLLATDGSEKNRDAKEEALWLAKRFRSALYALTVVDSNEVLQIHAPDILDSFFTRARENLNSIVEDAKNLDIKCTGIIKEGSITDSLVQVFKEVRPDLLVLGSEGRTGLNRVLMGSVANSVMKKISSPILVVKKRLL